MCISFVISVSPTNNQIQVESVIVAESGEDSDDEWNYIKVDKDDKSVEGSEADREADRSDAERDNCNQLGLDSTASATTPSVGEPDIEAHIEDFPSEQQPIEEPIEEPVQQVEVRTVPSGLLAYFLLDIS